MKKIKKKNKPNEKKSPSTTKTETQKNSNPQSNDQKDTIGRRIYQYSQSSVDCGFATCRIGKNY